MIVTFKEPFLGLGWYQYILKISLKSIDDFLHYFTRPQTKSQTDRQTDAICYQTSLVDNISSSMHSYSTQYTHIHMLVTLQSSTLFMASSISSLSRSALAVSAWVFVPEIIDLVACNHLNWGDKSHIRINMNLLYSRSGVTWHCDLWLWVKLFKQFKQTLLWQNRSPAPALPAVSSASGCLERPPSIFKTQPISTSPQKPKISFLTYSTVKKQNDLISRLLLH